MTERPGREFTDRGGVRWRVFEIAASAEQSGGPRERRAEPRSGSRGTPKAMRLTTRPLELAWLCFESLRERRRVSPVPSAWTELADDELEDLLGASEAC